MRHLDEGLLRRLHDDRFAASNAQRAHLAGCTRCQERLTRVAADADGAAALLAAGTGPAVQVEPALARLRARIASGADEHSTAAAPQRLRRRRWAVALVAVPAVVAAAVGTAGAEGWLSVFSPTAVAPVVLTSGDLTGLPDLSSYGRMHVVTRPTETAVAGAGEAAARSDLSVLQPASLPPDVPTTVTWEVIGAGSASFTLDQNAADASAAAAGRPAPHIPAALDGTTVTVNGGPAVVAVYGGSAAPSGGPRAAGEGTVGALEAGFPALVIGETARPTASTNGASLQQLEDFLLAQPGISAQLAAEIRTIGSPASTLPIPIISGVTTSETITVEGVQGVVTGDPSGLGTAVIWEKDGVVHAVAGTLARSEVVAIAQSLR